MFTVTKEMISSVSENVEKSKPRMFGEENIKGQLLWKRVGELTMLSIKL